MNPLPMIKTNDNNGGVFFSIRPTRAIETEQCVHWTTGEVRINNMSVSDGKLATGRRNPRELCSFSELSFRIKTYGSVVS